MIRQSLREIAYEAIREWIGGGQLASGSVTSEFRLAEQLDMSRTPIRAALQQLETEGFLRIVPKHGILIVHSSAQRVSDLLETLISLILFTFEQHRHHKFNDIINVINQFEIHSVLHESAETASKHEAHFWLQLISLGQNQEMIRVWRTTVERLHWANNHGRWKPLHREQSVQCMEKLLSAMANNTDRVIPELFSYLHILKKTWI